MITISLRELAEGKGILNSYQLRKRCLNVETGKELSKSVISQLWKGDMQKIGLGTIEAVCVGLECTPSDWIIVTAPIIPRARNGDRTAKGQEKPQAKQVARPAVKKSARKKQKRQRHLRAGK